MADKITADQQKDLNRFVEVQGFGDKMAAVFQAGTLRFKKWVNALLGTTTGAHAAVTDNGAQQTITTGITQPDYPRNVTATAGGTNTDIKAVQVIVNGLDIEGNVIQETLPAFTVDTAGTVTGNRAFARITSYVIPAHDGTGATTALGYGAKLGLDRIMPEGNWVLQGTMDGTREATFPTVVTDASEVSKNTITFNTALDGAKDPMVLFVDHNAIP